MSLKMPQYKVLTNSMYFNQVTNTFENGKILGDSQLQYGDQFEASVSQVSDAIASGHVQPTEE